MKISNAHHKLVTNWIEKIESNIFDLYEKSGENLPTKIKTPILSIQARSNKLRDELNKNEISLNFLDNIGIISERSIMIDRLNLEFGEKIDATTRMNLTTLSTTVSKGRDLLLELKIEDQKISRQRDGSDSLKKLEENLRIIDGRTRQMDDRIDSISKNIKSKIDGLLASYATTEAQLKDKLQLADETIDNIKSKEAEVNNLVGIVSGTSIAGSYSESARAELELANSMRNGSVFLMLTVSMLVGYSLLETSSPHFDWQTAIFRLIFSVALSIPAAYLTRESAKHRNKQYEFQKISLDLKSISPYLASLPLVEQHKLKSDMAGKIFTPATTAPQSESYPIDIQSILHKIIDKIPQSQATQTNDSVK